MDVTVLLKGFLAGITIAAPLGPVNLICIHRTLVRGGKNGFVSGMGAAVADTLYGIIAGFGLTLVSGFLIDHELMLRGIGGLIVILFGLRVFTRGIKQKFIEEKDASLLKEFTSTFLLTLTNPLTIAAFLAIFAGLGLTTKNINHLRATVLVLGVFAGASFWWSILIGGVDFFRERFTDGMLKKINHAAGFIISAFGIFLILSVFVNVGI